MSDAHSAGRPQTPRATDSTGQPYPPNQPQLRRVLTFRDLVLYYSVTGFSLRWIATAAAAGPSALVIWVVAALGFFVPLVFSTLELSSRYPEEGGIYVWSKRAFGDFSGFMTAWTRSSGEVNGLRSSILMPRMSAWMMTSKSSE